MPLLLEPGLRSLSVAPALLGAVKAAIAADAPRSDDDAMTTDRGEVRSAAGVAEYKAILQRVLETRPSGTRQRIAAALAKNRSFVTQITSPAYDTPIPARHVDLIFEICHFSPAERDAFLAAYRARASEPAARRPRDAPRLRAHTVYLPDLGAAEKNRQLDALVGDFVQKLDRTDRAARTRRR